MKIITCFTALITGMLITLLVTPLNSAGDNTLLLFLGRFHPLVLHIPIGALLALFVVEFIQCIRTKLKLGKACEILLWVCVLSSIPAVLAGYLLASSGGYSESLLDRHMWLGWATVLLCTWLLALRYWANARPNLLWPYRALLFVNVILLSLAGHYGGSLTHGSDYLTKYMPVELKNLLGVDRSEAEKMLAEIKEQEAVMQAAKESGEPSPVAAVASIEDFAAKKVFAQHVQPIMDQYCYSCHGADKQKGEIRLDDLNWDMINGPHAESWHTALDQINAGEMPPKGKAQPNDEERRLVVDWITDNLEKAAIAKRGQPQNIMRRLTRQQYTNTLNDLLSLNINFGEVLPSDAKSEMGFTNDAKSLQTSPLHFDYFQLIAREALGQAIVTGDKPKVMRYKVEFGKDIGIGETGGKFGGSMAQPLDPNDMRVSVLKEDGMPTTDRSINNLQGKIGVGLRGSAKDRYRIGAQGMTLYSALPHEEVVPKSWQGPSPNMKMLIKDIYPGNEPFMLRVEASPGEPFSLLKEGFISLREKKRPVHTKKTIQVISKKFAKRKNMTLKQGEWLAPKEITLDSYAESKIKIPERGLYRIDLEHPYVEQDAMPSYTIEMSGDWSNPVSGMRIEERIQIDPSFANKNSIIRPITLAFLDKKDYVVSVGGSFFVGFRKITFTPLAKDTAEYQAFIDEQKSNARKFNNSMPALRAFAGTRTDDGMDYQNFDSVRKVVTARGQPAVYEFRGHFQNLPVPNAGSKLLSGHLANTMLVGVWNDYLVNEAISSGPPVVIHSMELEAPYYEQWPPKSHTDIFFESTSKSNEALYAREVIRRFMERAFRRDVSEREVNFYHDFWKKNRIEFDNFQDSVKEVFVGILCSPNFLYILQPQEDEALESTGESLLASQLSYFLWNQPPDAHLIELAANGTLSQSLNSEIDRMIGDPKILNMIKAFAYEWLRIDRLDQINTDTDTYPDFNRFTKESMANETYHFIKQVLQEDLSIMHLIDSDFTMLNKYLADFYGIEGVEGSDFRKVQLPSDSLRGGLLTQGAFLTGHSDGIQSHPIKRAVWLKEKILGEKPPPAPPNVPELDPDTPGFEKLSLKEQLELHRNKASCVDCHLKIDPYGVVFENFNATGSFIELIKNKPVDAATKLPDGTEVEGVEGIKQYILESRTDSFTEALVEHMFAYALGRILTFADEAEIEAIVAAVREEDYRFRSVVKQIVNSESFLKQAIPNKHKHKHKDYEQKELASR
jgi:uncharacterized membrane protein/mono/diheme cytochrome c family protein